MEFSEQKEASTYKVLISGRFTFEDHANFRKIVDTIKNESFAEVILELSKVEFVDSAALGMFLVAREVAEEKNLKIILQSPSEALAKMFKISKFDTLFTIT